MSLVRTALATRVEIVRFYKRATYCYAAPFVFLLFSFILPYIGVLGLFTLLPFGIAGLFFTRRGLALASKTGDQEKKDVGYANLTLGIIILLIGLLALALVFYRTK